MSERRVHMPGDHPDFQRPPAQVEKDRAINLARSVVRAKGLTLAGPDTLLLSEQLLRALHLTA